MLDVFNLPKREIPSDVQVFPGSTSSTFTEYTYNVPRGKTMLYVYAVGAGGGGGGGFSGTAGTARGGGGGGGSGTVMKSIVPIAFLPNTLYIRCPRGGTGGTAGNAGGNPEATIISIHPDATTEATNVLLRTGLNVTGGSAGSGTAGGTAGVTGGSVLSGNVPLSGLGLFIDSGGQDGTAGGAHTGQNGTALFFPTGGCNVTGGCGGAGTTSADFVGGSINSTSSYVSENRPIAPASGSNNGSAGYTLGNYFYHYGGTGGSSSNSGVGGNGGNGAYGCGGGGGGGGTTGGTGGNGGPGLVVMIAW